MKLSELRFLLENAIPQLEVIIIENLNAGTNTITRISNLNTFRSGLEILRENNLFLDIIAFFDNTVLSRKITDVVEITTSEGKIIRENVNAILTSVRLLNQSLKLALPQMQDIEHEQNSIFIKLPETTSLEELSKSISVFSKILSNTIVNDKINGEIVLECVEPGSVWLKVYVGSLIAVNVIGGMAWAATVISKKYEESRYVEQMVMQQELENEHKKNLIDAHKKITNILISAEAKNLYDEFYSDEKKIDNDQFERLKLSLELLSEQIHKGAQVNPALTAPESVTNLFPDVKAPNLIESKIKKLEK